MKYFAPIAAAALLVACEAGSPPAEETPAEVALPDIQASAIEEHITFLASDELGGRDAGSEGYRIAADYVASQFADLGLQPAGDDGYFADVPMQEARIDVEYGRVELFGESFAHGEGVMIGLNQSLPQSEVTAPLIYVGHGVSAPERGHDDYADIDVTGAIVVLRGGVPEIFPSDERAHHISGATKAAVAAENGAVGVLTLSGADAEQITRFASGADRPSVRLTPRTGAAPSDQLRVTATLGAELRARVFEQAEMSWEEVAAAAADEENPVYHRMPLNISATLRQRTISEPFTDVNVVGLLPGDDPDLADEIVVLTAHLDHIGMITDNMRASGACRRARANNEGEASETYQDDMICNGAVDNASGVSIMIETARTFIANGAPRRSVLFVALAAEEKGLLGSQHFARNPTVPAVNMVANVNLDMPVIVYEFDDVIAFGAEHSNLGPIAERAAARLGVTISPDPMPEQTLFVRSDHYNFVRAGLPSLFLMTGFSSPNPEFAGGAGFTGFLGTYYHRVSDQLVGDFDVLFDQAAKFANINYIIAREIADADESPSWNEDSFFGGLYGAGE
jgi:hypothetical protein